MTAMDCVCDENQVCEYHRKVEEIGPVQVSGKMEIINNLEAADYGAYSTWTFTGTTTDEPVRILSHDDKRSRAVIQVDASTVYVGKKENIRAGQAAIGGVPLTSQGWAQTSTMMPLEIKNKQELWAIAKAGAPCNVMVLNERWE